MEKIKPYLTPKYLIPLALGLLGIGLRIFDLGAAKFWYDEIITAWMGKLPWAKMIAATAGDTHPPLYLALIWVWERIGGTGEAWLRIPSLLASIAAIPLVWVISGRLGLGRPARLGAMALLVISPFQIHFSQEARMYALLQVITLFIWWGILERDWWAVGLGCLAMLYTHNYGLFYWPVLLIYALARELPRPIHISLTGPYRDILPWRELKDQANLKGLLASFLIPLALWSPWAIVLAGQISNISGGYWIQPVTPGGILYTLYMLFWGFAMPEQLQALSALVNAGILIYCIIQLIRSPRDYAGLAWLALAPLTLACLVSLIKPVLLFRGLIASSPVIYLWAAKSLIESKPVYKWIYSGGIIIPLVIAGLWGFYRYNPDNKGDISGFIEQVNKAYQPGETIYHLNDGTMVLWSWYAPQFKQVEISSCPDEDLGSLSPQTRQAMGITQAPYPGGGWIIWGDGPTSTQCEKDKAQKITGLAKLYETVRNDQFIFTGIYHKGGE